jgi:hypothetical protein
MEDIIIRKAEFNDIPFLVETIIEAEKSGTDRLSYITVFGLTLEDSKKYISKMLEEDIDGCELSISSYLVAESNGILVAASSAWVEGEEGISSAEIKGNLLNFVLPVEAIRRVASLSKILKQVHLETKFGSLQKGVDYVIMEYRKKGILRLLTEKNIERILKQRPDISEVFTQVFSCNEVALRANEKIGFEVVDYIESKNEEILKYLPSNKKLLLKRSI